ncbi:MAG: hypothetical protein WDW38_006434 [Sanguina aurantia]
MIDCVLFQTFDIKPAAYDHVIKYYYLRVQRMPEGLLEAINALNGEQVTDVLMEPLLDLLQLGAGGCFPWVLIQNQQGRHIGAHGDTRGRVPLGSSVSRLVSVLRLGLTNQSRWACVPGVRAASVSIAEILIREQERARGT